MAENLLALTARVSEERRLEECPFCLEQHPIFWKRPNTCSWYSCCGKWCCKKCAEEWEEKAGKSANRCPLCRTPEIATDIECFARLMEHAKKGKPWAQEGIGAHYAGRSRGTGGVSVNSTEAEKWYRKAAEQGWYEGSYALGLMYEKGNGVPKSRAEARRFFEIAAESKDAEPMLALSHCCTSHAEKGKRVQLLRLSAEQGLPVAQSVLGCELFNRGSLLSLKDGFSWLVKAADQGVPSAQLNVSQILIERKLVPGVPKALYWLRKASAGSDAVIANKAREELSSWDNAFKSCCARCDKMCPNNVFFQRCVRCRGMYYCGRECQSADWKKTRHKKDCIPKDIEELSPDDRQNLFISYCFP